MIGAASSAPCPPRRLRAAGTETATSASGSSHTRGKPRRWWRRAGAEGAGRPAGAAVTADGAGRAGGRFAPGAGWVTGAGFEAGVGAACVVRRVATGARIIEMTEAAMATW